MSSDVSIRGGWIERVETGEIIEIATIHTVFVQVAEKMAGWQKRLCEYPTIGPPPLRSV
jgi:hypothetical protein